MSTIDTLFAKLCPDGVPFMELGSLGYFYNGLSGKTKKDFESGNCRYISYMNVFSNIATNLTADDFVNIDPNEQQQTIQKGDVLFTISSEKLEESGLTSVVTAEVLEPVYLNSFCLGFRFNDPGLFNPDFVKFLFRSTFLRHEIVKTANGVTRYNISRKRLAKVRIPFPPLAIQTEIAKVLGTFSQLETELKAELEARQKQYAYYRNKLLTYDPTTARGQVWEEKTLGDIGVVKMCKRILKQQTSPTGEIPFYKIGTFGKQADAYISKELFLTYRNAYSFPNKGDILLSAAGTIGRNFPYDGQPAYFQDSNIVWLAHDESIVLNSYLKYFYDSFPWQVSTGGTITRLYNGDILRTKIAVPPLEEQQRIASILDKFDTLVNDLTCGLPAEIEARRKQYEYYANRLLTFPQAQNGKS